MNEYGAQIGITPFTDTKQSILVSRTVLSRSQADRGGHLPAIGKVARIANGSDEGRGDDGTNAAQLQQTLSLRVALRNGAEFLIQFRDAIIQRLEIQPKTFEQTSEPNTQTVLSIFKPQRYRSA